MSIIQGHHHISMITKDIKMNNHFYQDILGLRRVKVSVNQDDPFMYHFFYGDYIGSPGTGLTFFEMPIAGQTYRGTNAITKIGLVVPSTQSLMYWKERFKENNVNHHPITSYFHHEVLPFEDPDGLQLMLISSNEKPMDFKSWESSPIEKEHQILGIGPVEIIVRRLQKIKRTLYETLQYKIYSETDDAIIFQSSRGIFSEIIVKSLDGSREKPERGSIHHLAIRVKDEDELKYWEGEILKQGLHSSGIIDRYYFKSIYFRDSNGIVFEIATDEPGFTINESAEMLGKHLDLPPFLEEKRASIKKRLTPIEEI